MIENLRQYLAHLNASTYLAFGIWVATGFMAQPGIVSAVVHFVLEPAALGLLIWRARREVR